MGVSFPDILTLTGILVVAVITILIYRKLQTPTSLEELIEIREKINHDNEEIRKVLDELRNKLQTLEYEFETKVVKNVAQDLNNTKESIVSQLLDLKENVHEMSEKNTNLSFETKQKLLEMENKINKTIRDISDSISKSISELYEKLGRVSSQLETMEKLAIEVQTLQNILRPPKQRGIFGEALLENLIKEVFPKDRYRFQYPLGTNKVDAILVIDGKLLPIDSKFPLDNFLKVLDGKRNKKDLINDIKKMIDDISEKYIKPAECNTTNFAFMYIPSESVWYETFILEPEVYKYAIDKRVFPVSPNTFMSYLHVILEGLKAFEIEQNVEQVISEMNSLKNEIEKAVKEYTILETHLNKALKKVNATKQFLQNIHDKIDSFGESNSIS
ncbi:MAG: DNA recombination protein RmuC [Desulfurobacteriaceae bacterium]